MTRKPVLVVDDDTAIRRLLTMILEEEGYDVSASASGEEALERISRTPQPKVVLLDILLPGIDGWEVLRRIRGDNSQEPTVILMTAGSVQSEQQREFSDVTLVRKPFDADHLLGLIEEAVTA